MGKMHRLLVPLLGMSSCLLGNENCFVKLHSPDAYRFFLRRTLGFVIVGLVCSLVSGVSFGQLDLLCQVGFIRSSFSSGTSKICLSSESSTLFICQTELSISNFC